MTVTTIEPAQSVPAQAREAAIAEFNSHFKTAVANAEVGSINWVSAFNHFREAGFAAQTACGHNQMQQGTFDLLAQWLDPKADWGMVQICMSFARRYEKPIKSLAEAGVDIKIIQIGLGFIAPPARQLAAVPADPDLTLWIINSFRGVETQLDKRLKESPMDCWDRTSLELVVERTQKFVEVHNQAEELLKKK